MNEKNLDYLKKVLDNLGFGTRLNEVLETAIRRELPRFTLGLNNTYRPVEAKDKRAPRTDHIRFELNFNKAKESDMYFLNDYLVTLRKQGEPIPRFQTFDLERDHRVTALQAWKLLSGLCFEKDVYQKQTGEDRGAERPEKTKVWFKLNLDVTDAYGNHPLRTFYPEYQYNLSDSLTKYPLKGLEDPAKKEEVLKNLKYGNLQDAELTIGKKSMPVMLAANPQMKTVDIYDKNMKEIRYEEISPEKAVMQTTKGEPPVRTQKEKGAIRQSASVEVEQPWKQEPEVKKSKTVAR